MKNIKVNIPDGHVIDTENSDLEKGIITFKKEESKYPMELDSAFLVRQISRSFTHSQNDEERKYWTFIALVETCKDWNRIDGFEADWDNDLVICIYNYYDSGIGVYDDTSSRPLPFENVRTAELFLETFREEIELVKDLI